MHLLLLTGYYCPNSLFLHAIGKVTITLGVLQASTTPKPCEITCSVFTDYITFHNIYWMLAPFEQFQLTVADKEFKFKLGTFEESVF